MLKKYKKIVYFLLKCKKFLYIYSMSISGTLANYVKKAVAATSVAPAKQMYQEPGQTDTDNTTGTTTDNTTGITQSSDDLLKAYKDGFEREQKNAQARQTQNLNAARLNAQQTAALAGYSPDMAQRAMFEQTAGAYKSNQEIENELARLGVDMAEKQHGLYEKAGYDYNPTTGEYTYTPPWMKENIAQEQSYKYWSDLAESGNEYAKQVKSHLDSQLGQGSQAIAETKKDNKAYSDAERIEKGESLSSFTPLELANAYEKGAEKYLRTQATKVKTLENVEKGQLINYDGKLYIVQSAPEYYTNNSYNIFGGKYKTYGHYKIQATALDSGATVELDSRK